MARRQCPLCSRAHSRVITLAKGKGGGDGECAAGTWQRTWRGTWQGERGTVGGDAMAKREAHGGGREEVDISRCSLGREAQAKGGPREEVGEPPSVAPCSSSATLSSIMCARSFQGRVPISTRASPVAERSAVRHIPSRRDMAHSGYARGFSICTTTCKGGGGPDACQCYGRLVRGSNAAAREKQRLEGFETAVFPKRVMPMKKYHYHALCSRVPGPESGGILMLVWGCRHGGVGVEGRTVTGRINANAFPLPSHKSRVVILAYALPFTELPFLSWLSGWEKTKTPIGKALEFKAADITETAVAAVTSVCF
ncbi:hypothetical protein EI94DRAFT_1710195 [Lactarius quietus]|nr:hypothetical protein EI94DRAFT_1710195 [Lactarius quietus]